MYETATGQKEYAETSYADRDMVKAAREGSIAREYGNLQKMIDVLRASIGELDDRLQPILSSEPPTAENATGNPREVPACTLAQSMSSDASSLNTLNERLTSIIRRIQL